MTFKHGETVLYSYNDHRRCSTKDGPRSIVKRHTIKAKFLELYGPKSARLEFSTPAGAYVRPVPIKNVSKLKEER